MHADSTSAVDISELVRTLQDASLDVEARNNAALALKNLSNTAEFHGAIVGAGAIPVLLGVLHVNGDVRIKFNASIVLANLSETAEFHRAIVEAGAIPVLLEVFQSNDGVRIKQNASFVLASLSETAEFFGAIIEAGAIPVLLEVLQGNSIAHIKGNVLYFFEKLVKIAEFHNALVVEGAIPVLVEIVQNVTFGEIIKQSAVDVLANLSRNAGFRGAIVEANAIPWLVEILHNPDFDEEIKQNAIYVLANLSIHAEFRDAIVNAGPILALIVILQNESFEEGIKRNAATILINLSGVYKYDDAAKFLSMLQGGGTPAAQFFAIQLVLLALCGESDDQAASMDLFGMVPQLLEGFSSVPYPISCDIFMRTESGRKVLSLLWDGADELIKGASTNAFNKSIQARPAGALRWIGRRGLLSSLVGGEFPAVSAPVEAHDEDSAASPSLKKHRCSESDSPLRSLLLDKRIHCHDTPATGVLLTNYLFGLAVTFLPFFERVEEVLPGGQVVESPREIVEQFVGACLMKVVPPAHCSLEDDAVTHSPG